mmetsp:Transcript_27921/g.75929  ORF Transcript_27921/g.75929 Transcript_27921/m.75929 type:complete len:291 (-) Transcript_27921:413-1285(-)
MRKRLIRPSIHPSVHSSIHPFIHPSVRCPHGRSERKDPRLHQQRSALEAVLQHPHKHIVGSVEGLPRGLVRSQVRHRHVRDGKALQGRNPDPERRRRHLSRVRPSQLFQELLRGGADVTAAGAQRGQAGDEAREKRHRVGFRKERRDQRRCQRQRNRSVRFVVQIVPVESVRQQVGGPVQQAREGVHVCVVFVVAAPTSPVVSQRQQLAGFREEALQRWVGAVAVHRVEQHRGHGVQKDVPIVLVLQALHVLAVIQGGDHGRLCHSILVFICIYIQIQIQIRIRIQIQQQ